MIERNYTTLECGNLYALVVERALGLTRGRLGFILPLSSTNANGNASLQSQLRQCGTLHISHFAVRPSKLFNGVDMNLTIVCGAMKTQRGSHSTTKFNRWQVAFRESLFSTLCYVSHAVVVKHSAFPKFGTAHEVSIWQTLDGVEARLRLQTGESPSSSLAFHGFGRYWRKCITERLSDNYQEFSIASHLAPFATCLLNSQLCYWYWIVSSDCYRFTKTDALNLTIPKGAESARFGRLADRLLHSYERHSVVQRKVARNGKVTAEKQFFPVLSKDIIDEIDRVLARHYGFTEEELDFIINYDIKYRMGREAEVEEQP